MPKLEPPIKIIKPENEDHVKYVLEVVDKPTFIDYTLVSQPLAIVVLIANISSQKLHIDLLSSIDTYVLEMEQDHTHM